ncbi:MAG TPA: prepilin-type N-terminal cleavage/methylation domain-containing protein [Polyangiales bacterium]|nr:prepilin-type N-terminal cleavage/methylation domain-containing protein [Polyangiales bacterium]
MRTRAGFTVVELMIALTVGGIAIASLYTIGSASMRTFREQDRIATTQSSLRAAMAQVKRDFSRAGFLTTPNINQQAERCTPPIPGAPLNDTGTGLGRGRLAAISAYHQNVDRPKQLDPDDLNKWATVDDVMLMGNYATSGEYMGVIMDPNGLRLTIPFSTQSFTRDFTHWYDASGGSAGDCNERALSAAFTPGRLLRLHTLSEQNVYSPISKVGCDTANKVAVIEVSDPIPTECNATSGWASPVSTIRYYAADVPDEEGSRTTKNRVVTLRRTEMNPLDKTKILEVNEDGATRAVDDRAVLDFVVRFSVQFLMRQANQTNSMDFVPATEAMVQANPELVRGAIIEIAARTAEQEPDMTMLPDVRLPPFKVMKTRGAARTRALRAELLLPNIANKGY